MPDYDRLMAAAATVDAKRMRRMYGRAAAATTTTTVDADSASTTSSGAALGAATSAAGGASGGAFPPLGGSDRLEPRPASKPISKVVGKQQALAAERLSRASVKQTQPSAAAAASNGGGNFVFDPTTAGGEEGVGGDGDAAGLKYAEQVSTDSYDFRRHCMAR